jgi:hypothetical protein
MLRRPKRSKNEIVAPKEEVIGPKKETNITGNTFRNQHMH